MSLQKQLKTASAKRKLWLDRIFSLDAAAQEALRDSNNLIKFKMRYEDLEIIRSEFTKNHFTIIEIQAQLEDGDLEGEAAVLKQFDDYVESIKTAFYNLFSKDEKLFPNMNQSLNANQSFNQNFNHGTFPAYHPRINVPNFDGNLRDWPTFIDLFTDLYHDNPVYTNSQKYNILITFLSKNPLSIVKAIPNTGDNYLIAFKALKERYDNPRLLAQTYYHEIFNFPKVKSESPEPLRNLLDCVSENLEALRALGLPTKEWSYLIFQTVISKLDSVTIQRFELENASRDIPKYETLKAFLENQCTALETLSVSSSSSSTAIQGFQRRGNSKNKQFTAKPNSSCFLNSIDTPLCQLCSLNHNLEKCPTFKKKSPFDRYRFVKQKLLCLLCLSSSHMSSECHSKTKCSTCQSGHHSLLHFVKKRPENGESNRSGCGDNETLSSTVGIVCQPQILTSKLTNNYSTVLSTVIAEVEDRDGRFHPFRALLDCGSQISLLSEKCLNALRLKITYGHRSIYGLGDLLVKSKGSVSCTIRSPVQGSPSIPVDFVVLKKICSSMPGRYISKEELPHIENIRLADPQYYTPSGIDILLGADVFPLIIRSGTENSPALLNTIFGFALMGKLANPVSSQTPSFCGLVESSATLENDLKRFWELEDVPAIDSWQSPEDVACEDHFLKNYSRDENGRFTVALPFKGAEPSFGNSREIAMRKFHALERKFIKDPLLHISYNAFMKEYLEAGFMEKIPKNLLNQTYSRVYYLPHHPVFKPESTTTKLRVVFDASYKVEGKSLNDTLYSGPKLQQDIRKILINFRRHKIAFSADIRKMYLQVRLAHQHHNYQRILWRFSQNEPLVDYNLVTLSFGVSSSPYLALRCIAQLAEDEKVDFPEASEVLKSDIYIDDVCTGASTVELAQSLQLQLIELLKRGGFTLRKFVSNDRCLLESIPVDFRHQQAYNLDLEGSGIKILGLKWNPVADVFTYNVKVEDRPCSKRVILSELARVFDPMGFLAPISFFLKYMIQHLWFLRLGWNEKPPENIVQIWLRFKSELPALSQLEIPRFVDFLWSPLCELMGFCDSSEKGYAAMIYLRHMTVDGAYKCSLLCARTKVAPLKKLTLPRLELCGCLLLANLIEFVTEAFSPRVAFDNIYAWSDSSVALHWINSPPHTLKTFVGNRVASIQSKLSVDKWYHVRSADNPADVASRGLMPQELVNHHLWWNGPSWLSLDKTQWPIDNVLDKPLPEEILEEERVVSLIVNSNENVLDTLLEKYSSFKTIKEILAYCLRFYHNATVKTIEKRKSSRTLVESEIHEALIVLVKHCQKKYFMEEINCINKRKLLPKSFRKLNPFLDSQNIIRVGGRLVNSDLSFNEKHPMLLPKNSRLTDLIIESTHKEYGHPGLQTLQYLVSQNFWILSSKRAIRSVLSKCLICFRQNPKPFQPMMGNLPALRVSQLKPFLCVGVDFGGPFKVTMSKSRGAKASKAYLCLFVCFATKAVHLELVSDLSSEAFLLGFRRFIARRGRCAQVFSDCGTNFVGANKYIVEIMESVVKEERIEWKFNPPSAPNFGGLWEAGIKQAKRHLTRIIGDQALTYEELSTVFTQLEAVLNSRPLCPLSSDPSDLSVLTPGHFLNLEPLTVLPDFDITNLKMNRLTRYQLLIRIHQDFWKRWHREYLHTLMQRNKWSYDDPRSISLGTLVVLVDNSIPPMKWKLGKIIKVFPGSDGIIRVATVKTSKGEVQRPLNKLCPLPNVDIE